MKKVIFYSLAGLFILLLSSDLFAQNVTIDGIFRPRYEYRHGYKTIFPEGAQAANFISQRSRLSLKFANDKFRVGLSLQNVGVWGETGTLSKSDINGTAIHEAWGEILFSDNFSIKAGRQEIIYDDHRIFGSVDWTQQARSHDALLLRFNYEKTGKFDFGFAYNALTESLYRDPYTINNYKAMQYMHWHKDFNSFGVSFLFLNNGRPYINAHDTTDTGIAKENIAYTQTSGPRVTFKQDKFSANAALYYQSGKRTIIAGLPTGNDTTMKTSAVYFALDFAYQLHEMFSAGLGFEYLSGNNEKKIADSDNGKETEKAFSPFYGTNHKFNGWMDYFYVGNHFYSVGLIDIFIPLKFKKDKFAAMLIPHFFQSAGTIYRQERDENWMPVVDDTGDPVMKEFGKGLGTEIDIAFSYSVSKPVAVKAGFSVMMPSESMQYLKNTQKDKLNSWGWVMLIIKPTFYQSK